MLASSVDLLREKLAFWRGPRTKASLGRVTEDVYGTEWEPRWTDASSPYRESPEMLTARQSARLHPDHSTSSDEPFVSVYWETERSFSPGLQDALTAARFNTSCCSSLPQHVCYTWDNNLYLMNYLKAACPVLFDTEVEEPIITLPATILSNTTIYPLPDLLPDNPIAVIVIATATQISFYGVYPEEDATILPLNPRTQICLVNQPSKQDDLVDQFTHEIVQLRISAIPKYSVPTNGRLVSAMVGDASGRLFLCFEDDGLGVHELVYRCRGSLLNGPLILRRLIRPNGAVASRRVLETESVPGAVLSVIETALSEAQSAVSRMMLPQPPHRESARVRFLLAQESNIIVTIDDQSETRIYVAQPPDDSPQSTKKRKKPIPHDKTDGADTPMMSSSPPRKRRLDNGDVQSVMDCPGREEFNGSSSCGALCLASELTLPFLACEFFKSDHFDARFLSAQGLGVVSDATLSPSLTPGVSVLTLTTSSARKIELALDCSDPENFQFGLLGVQSIDFPSERIASELPSPVMRERAYSPKHSIPRVDHSIHSVKSQGFTKSWKKGPIFVCTFTRALDVQLPELMPEALRSPLPSYRPSHNTPQLQLVNLITLGLHPSVAPLSMCRAPQNDGFMTFETSEPVRMIIDADGAWVSSLDFHEEMKASRLPDGSGLLDIGLENCILRVGAQDALLRGGPSMSRNAPRGHNPFHRTFWVFHDTFFRKLHIKWGGLDLLPSVNSLPLTLVENLDGMSTGNFPKVVLHPDDGGMEQPEMMTWRSTELGLVAPVIPSPSVEALGDVVSHLFGEILEQPLFMRDRYTDRLVVTWRHFPQVWILCKKLVRVLEAHRTNLHPSVLSTSKETADLALNQSNENLWLPLKGKGQIENICTQESKRALIFIDQRRQLSGLAAFVNLMSQIGSLVNTMSRMSDSWAAWDFNEMNLSMTVELAMEKSSHTNFPRLLSEPLANLLTNKRTLQPLTHLTQSLLEILTQLTATSNGNQEHPNLMRTDALTYMRIIVKSCGWLMSDNAFQVALRQRMSQACAVEDETEKAEALVRICLQFLPESNTSLRGQSSLIEATSLREKCYLVRIVIETLVLETRAVGSALMLIAHLATSQPPEDRDTFLDELYVCLQKLLQRLTNDTSGSFVPLITDMANGFDLLGAEQMETQELESTIQNISVTASPNRHRRQVSSSDLYSTSTARAKVRRTLVQVMLDQIFEETAKSVSHSAERGLARFFSIPKSLSEAASPGLLTELILIKFCESLLDDLSVRDSPNVTHLRPSAELLRVCARGFDAELLRVLPSTNIRSRLSAMTALIYGFSFEVSGSEKSAQMGKILLSQLPEISRHPYVSSSWFCRMATNCLQLNQSLASGRLPSEGETALDSLVESQCLGSGLTIADGDRIWVTVHKRWKQLIAKHQYCVEPLLKWIEDGLTALAVSVPDFGIDGDERSFRLFGRSERRITFDKTDIVPLSQKAEELLSLEGRTKLQQSFSELIDQALLEAETDRGLTHHMRARLVDLHTLTSSAASYLSLGDLLTIIYPAGALHLAARCLVVTWEPSLDQRSTAMLNVMISEFGQVLTVSALSPMRGLARLAGRKSLWTGPIPEYLEAGDAIALNVHATMQMVLLPAGFENRIVEELRKEFSQLNSFLKLIALSWLFTNRTRPIDVLLMRRQWLQDIMLHSIHAQLLPDDGEVSPAAMDSFTCLVDDARLAELAGNHQVVNNVWEFFTRPGLNGDRAKEIITLLNGN